MEDLILKQSSDDNDKYVLADDISEEDAAETSRLIERFVKSYSKKDENTTTEQWLSGELKNELPEKSSEEII